MINIAFCGEIGSGKSTCCSYLEDIYGMSRFAFADKMKLDLIDMGADPEHVYGQKTALSRAMLQAVGDYFTTECPDYLITPVLDGVKEAERFNSEGACIEDLRRRREWSALDKNWVLVRIVCSRPHPMCTTTVYAAQHITENEWKELDPDFVITAAPGDIASIYEQVDNIINKLLRRENGKR